MTRTEIINVADLLKWEPFLSADVLEDLESIQPPAVFKGKEAPQSLEGLSLEELLRLQDAAANNRLIYGIMEVFYGSDQKETDRMPAIAAVGLRNMVTAELERINGLFASLGREFTPTEILAGAESLDFGIFGLADWYARRMGITNHDEAFRTPWVRIYQCRRNDMELDAYHERLHERQIEEMRNRR